MKDVSGLLKERPVIAAVKDEAAFSTALKSNAAVLFLLKSDIRTVEKDVAAAHRAGKAVLVHVDLTEGLGKDDAAIRYIAECVRPDGIISVRPGAVRQAAALGLYTVFRVFLIDSKGVESAFSNIAKCGCDAVEIMPGIMPAMTKRFSAACPRVIVGGLISTADDIRLGLSAGATAASTSAAELWDMP